VTDLPTRDRLLEAAAGLFYAEGITAVGVDRICSAAGVSKRSLYALFGTKDALVAASLERFGERIVAGYLPATAMVDGDQPSPREQILGVFTWLESAAATPDYEGCPFVSAATELKDPAHPAAAVAKRFKDRLTAFFESAARSAGAPDPADLAQQLTVVFDGCGDRVVVTGHALNGLPTRMATTLLDAAGVRR